MEVFQACTPIRQVACSPRRGCGALGARSCTVRSRSPDRLHSCSWWPTQSDLGAPSQIDLRSAIERREDADAELLAGAEVLRTARLGKLEKVRRV